VAVSTGLRWRIHRPQVALSTGLEWRFAPARAAGITENGVEVDHATLNRWVRKYVPVLEQEFRAHKRPVGPSAALHACGARRDIQLADDLGALVVP
jgi:hypothetical protein